MCLSVRGKLKAVIQVQSVFKVSKTSRMYSTVQSMLYAQQENPRAEPKHEVVYLTICLSKCKVSCPPGAAT